MTTIGLCLDLSAKETPPNIVFILADDPQYAAIKSDLRGELLVWMEASGDLGQETELNAPEHMLRNR